MKCEVTLYVAGQVFKEEVIARDYQEARQVALARNPNAKVIGVTAVFKGKTKMKNSEHNLNPDFTITSGESVQLQLYLVNCMSVLGIVLWQTVLID